MEEDLIFWKMEVDHIFVVIMEDSFVFFRSKTTSLSNGRPIGIV